MDFSQVRAITIPEGNVTRILSGATVLWKKTGGLPSAYQEVEYIESDGSQYIDTGVIGKTGLHIVTEMGYVTPSTGTALFGSRDPRFFVTLYPSTTIDIGYNNDNSTGVNAESRKIYNIDFDTSTSPARFGIDGSYITSNNQVDTNRNIYIFSCNRNGTAAALSKSIFKSMKITDGNGKLLRNFVPCYRKSDGEIGMYDLVSSTFFTNSGSGTFIKGADVT